DAIDLDAYRCGVGGVEPRDPSRDGPKQFLLAGYHHYGIEPPDGLQLDQALAQAAFAVIDDLLDLRDQRFGCAVADGINSDGLTAHPVGVEAECDFDGRTALDAGALDDENIAPGVSAH